VPGRSDDRLARGPSARRPRSVTAPAVLEPTTEALAAAVGSILAGHGQLSARPPKPAIRAPKRSPAHAATQDAPLPGEPDPRAVRAVARILDRHVAATMHMALPLPLLPVVQPARSANRRERRARRSSHTKLRASPVDPVPPAVAVGLASPQQRGRP